MSTITFDTLKYAERLERGGFTREQARAEAEALAEAFDAPAQELATKTDVKTDTSTVLAELRALRAELMGEIKLNRWMLAALIGVAIANFAKQFF